MFKHKIILLSAMITLLMGSCGIQAQEATACKPTAVVTTQS